MSPLLLVLLVAALFKSSHASELISREKGRVDAGGNRVWYDAKLFGIEGKGWLDTESDYDRLPLKAKDRVRKPVWELGQCSSGMQIRFATTARDLHVRWKLTKNVLAMPHMPATGVSGIDLYYKDQKGHFRFHGNGRPTEITNTASFQLPDSEEYLLYLPLYNGVNLVEFGIPTGERLSKFSPPSMSRSIVFYGTSITQGGCASRPGMATSSIVSRALNVQAINLGFSGNGKMEPEIADLLSDLNPAIYILDCMWNMEPEMVSDRVEPFIKKLRQTRPLTPILLVEGSDMNNLPTSKGEILRAIYEKISLEGDVNLHYLSNSGMLGLDGEGTVDSVHFNDLGMIRQAALFIKCLKPILEEQKLRSADSLQDN